MDKGLTPQQFETMIADGAIIIDARDSAAFGGFHIPGSINIGFEKQLANWVGMVVDPQAEIILVVDDQKDYDRMVTELHRIGYDLIFGYLSGGIMAWLMSGRAVEQLEQTSPQQLAERMDNDEIRVIDVHTFFDDGEFGHRGNVGFASDIAWFNLQQKMGHGGVTGDRHIFHLRGIDAGTVQNSADQTVDGCQHHTA